MLDAFIRVCQHTFAYIREERQLPKTAAISLRVEPTLKARLEQFATKDGRPLAAYIERHLEMLAMSDEPPTYTLRDAQPRHHEGKGPIVTLHIADGWPVAVVTADHAERLGRQLIGAAQLARSLPPGE
jgi:predicted DNA-binding protein